MFWVKCKDIKKEFSWEFYKHYCVNRNLKCTYGYIEWAN